MQGVTSSPWFGLLDIVMVLVAIILWELKPSLTGWPLAVALLPWVLRISGGTHPFYKSSFDILFLVFVITSVLGIFLAYNQVEAFNKFWLVIAGILLFYAVAGQPTKNLRWVAVGTSILSPGMALLFLLTNDWNLYPAKIALLNRLGLAWMNIRPELPVLGFDPHPNLSSGVIVLAVPFLINFGLQAWREKKFLNLLLVCAGLILSGMGLLLATSRGALISLAGGLGGWGLVVCAKAWGFQIPASRKRLWVFSGFIGVLAVVWLAFSTLGASKIYEVFVDPTSTSVSRLELSHSAIALLEDFPFTGSGLHSFSGLYSTYIQVIPNFKVINSHNQYLDIALEEGPLGLLVFLLICLRGFWLLWDHPGRPDHAGLANVALASLMIICIHGMFDDILFNAWVTPLMFLVPGLIDAISHPAQESFENYSEQRTQMRVNRFLKWRWMVVGAGVLAVFVTVTYTNYKFFLASLYSNLGAVEMARVDLIGFPSETWISRTNADALKPAEVLFQKALTFNPYSRTANHRLGLIAMARQDFLSAVSYLEAAYQADSAYRGIGKSLGYSYVWIGQLDRAQTILRQIPEARQEMEIYSWWWKVQTRDDLARNAQRISEKLAASP